MLLAIEQGNTNTLFAVHDGQDWIAQWRTATEASRTADEYAVWLTQLKRNAVRPVPLWALPAWGGAVVVGVLMHELIAFYVPWMVWMLWRTEGNLIFTLAYLTIKTCCKSKLKTN